ncbi:MAG: VF530 family DNA-binding protein [Halopseudomonas sp.]
MTDDINYQNNPLHGLSLKNLLTEIVDHYGFEILFAYLNINCFKTNPSIDSSVKFLKKTDWAREKVEVFYLYKFKSLPRVSSEQYALPPRDRIVPADQVPGEPAELSLEDAERLREKQDAKTAAYTRGAGQRAGSGKRFGAQRGGGSAHRDTKDARKGSRESSGSANASDASNTDPWAKWKK